MADPAQQTTLDHDAIFAAAVRDADAFHGFDGPAIYTPEQRRQIGETARIIARRRGWLPLTERLAAEFGPVMARADAALAAIEGEPANGR